MDNTDVKKPVILTKPIVEKRKVNIAAGKVRNRTLGFYLLNRVRPFRFAMVLGLQRRGISTKNLPFRTIVGLYFNNFCANSFGIMPIDIVQWNNNIAFKITEKSDTGSELQEARNMTAFTQIAEVCDYIVELFREAKEKYLIAKMQGYEPKEVLTDEQFTQAKACMRVEKRLNNAERSDNYIKLSSVKAFIKWLIILVIIYYAITKL